MMEVTVMTRLEFLAIIYALKALCEDQKYEKLEKVLDQIIAEAENNRGRE